MLSLLAPLVVLLLTSRLSLAIGTFNGHHGSQIHWGPCDRFAIIDPSLECGFLDVPLDYHNPKLGIARLAIVKANATGERRGTVLLNPGGPGGSGLDAVSSSKDLLLQITGGIYDIVSWDPRGVGSLTIPGEIFCFDSVEEYNTFFNGTIELTGIEETGNFSDPADVQALLSQASLMQKKYEQVGKKCLKAPNGKFLRYIGTAAAVRDMVSIANIIDGPDVPINYIGNSYGTLVGSWFVNMFPERVGRVILNGVIDPILVATQEVSLGSISNQLVSVDTIYEALITGCALTGPVGCAAAAEGDGPADIDAKVQALINAAHDATRRNTSVPLTSGQLRAALFGEMYSPQDWASLVNEVYPQVVEIIKGESGQGLPFARRTKRPGEPHPTMNSHANETRAYTTNAIFCADSVDPNPNTNMTDVFEAIIQGTRTTSQMFGAMWPGVTTQCSFWPVRSVERYQGPFDRKLANKILITSSTYDPITPLAGAQVLAGMLGEDAALVRLNGFGHTALAQPSACINEIAVAYMTNGTLPANNTVCEVDQDVEVFQGVTTADILANMGLPVAEIV
ncbi:alpha/beta-hydrolase [Earliella scabrosa]|nr:alpha/beta-hydrolase [Earliella scabrosa]